MKHVKVQNGINEIKRTAHYTIPLVFVLCLIISFGKSMFFLHLPILTAVALLTQFLFGYFAFDKMKLSKSTMFFFLVLFVGMAVLSFSQISY
jgi:hypothetical protein